MKNLSIKFKLWGNLVLFLAFYIAMWGLSYYSSAKINDYLDPSKVEAMRQADGLRQSLADVEQLAKDAAQLKEADMLAEAERRAEDFRWALGRLKSLDKAHADEYERVGKVFEQYYRNAKRAAEMIISGEDEFSDELLARAEEVKLTLPGLRDGVEKILDRIYETFTSILDRSTRVATLLVTQNFVLLLSIVILSAIVFPIIIRSIIKPIEKLVDATNEAARGNLGVQTEVMSLDEIGALAIAFNRMTKSLKEKSEALEKTTEELKSSLDVRKEMQRRIIKANRELKDVNARLMEADKLKSDFLASMSHELRTPLNAIINFTDQIIEDWDQLPDDPGWAAEARGMLERVLKSSKHLLSLINDLLDLARIESGYVALDIAEVNIRELIADAVASVSSLAGAKGLDIGYTAPEGLPHFMVDERRILQVLINLLSNAIKFTDKGSVGVFVERSGDYPDGALIRVKDTGRGIPESHLKAVFDRFRQVEGGDSRSHAGTGLGLNLVKELTELHGGVVWVESKVGEGSVFTVYLPFRPPERPEEGRGNFSG
ncbi:MAG: ATP-binding protein [Candidatus Nitrospinota bacterium M3_3B_026]